MAYLLWKNDRAYIYDRDESGKQKCMQSLGVLGAREAGDRLNAWKVDNGRSRGSTALDRTMQSVWDEYLQYLVLNEYSWRTIRDMKQCVAPFIQTMERLRDLTPRRIEAWDHILQKWTYETNSGARLITTETRGHRLRAISAFCGWLKERKYLVESPFEVKIPAQRKDAGRALSGKDVNRLFENWQTESWHRPDHYSKLSKLFFQIVFFGGVRLSETLGNEKDESGATYENLDRENCILKLEFTKAGMSREVALPRQLVDSIPKGTGHIFYGKISEHTLRLHLANACKAAGIAGRFRIHDGRVTCATEWARKIRNPRASMDQFGWKSEKMAIHYNKVATEERVGYAQSITYQ